MDKSTRDQIRKAPQDARQLLESEFGCQLEGLFDILFVDIPLLCGGLARRHCGGFIHRLSGELVRRHRD